MAPDVMTAAEKADAVGVKVLREERGLYKPRPLPWRIITLAVLVLVVALSAEHPAVAVMASCMIAAILYCSVVHPERWIAIQADKRARARADSYNHLVEVFYEGGVFDDNTTPDMFALECVQAPEPDVFVFTTWQAGKTEDMIRESVEQSLHVFDAAYVKMDRVQGESRNSTYRITFASVSELESLAQRDVRYSQLLEAVENGR